MIEGFLETIREVGIFIVCAQAIVHFRAKASYEKYLKVLVSIIVLVMLLVPCFRVLGDVESFFDSMDNYESFLSGDGQMTWGGYDMEDWFETGTAYIEEENGGEEEVMSENIEIKTGLNSSPETIVIEPVEVIE